MNWAFLNPGVTTRLWTVRGSSTDRCAFKSFWLKRNALKYAAANPWPWVFITDERRDPNREKCLKAPHGHEWQLKEAKDLFGPEGGDK